jgi:hypothetical protein
MSTYLERLETLSPDIISDFRKKGTSNAIPVELQQYIRDMEKVLEIREQKKSDNITRLARELVKCRKDLSERTAKQRVYDAYNFFHVDDSISSAAWDNVYADKMEDFAKLCIAEGKTETALKAFRDAYRYRQNAAGKIDPGAFKPVIYIIHNKIRAEDLGYQKKSLHRIASKAKAGAYVKMIQGLPVDDKEKQRMINDAGLGDYADYEDVSDE